MDKPEKAKRPRGRPVELKMPERIPDTAENIARAVLQSPSKKAQDWKFMKTARARS